MYVYYKSVVGQIKKLQQQKNQSNNFRSGRNMTQKMKKSLAINIYMKQSNE